MYVLLVMFYIVNVMKILISLCVSHSKKFPEISYAKSCVLNMAAVLTLLYQRKLLTTRYVS